MPLGERFEAVLGAARCGDERAWVALYDDLAPVLTGYLTVQRAPHPEDTASEVLLQVVRDLDGFEGDEASFRSWVFTIAHHRLIDSRRHEQRRPSDATEVATLDRHLPSVDIEETVLDALTTEEMEALFGLLTPDQRDVLLLRIIGGMSLPEVGRALGKQHESVRALQKRALASLRKELATNPYPFHGGVALTSTR